MAEPDLLEDLSDELRQAFAWAQAVELGDDVGTRSVLIGMMRVGRGESDVEQLLRAFHVSPDVLYAALQDVAPEWRIDPYVPMLGSGAPSPVLTPNVERALRLARASRSPRRWSSSPVEASELFGAFLRMPNSTAYRGLARALDGRVSLDRVAGAHVIHLEYPNGLFVDTLRRRLGEFVSPPLHEVLKRTPPGSGPPVHVLALSPDGTACAGGHAGGGVIVWSEEWPGGRALGASERVATALAYSPDGDHLAAAVEGGSVLIWSAQNGELDLRLRADEERLWGLAWSPDGDRLAAVGAVGALHQWQLDAPASSVARPIANVPLRAVAWPTGGGVLALGQDGRLYRPGQPSEPVAVSNEGEAFVRALSADGRRMAVADVQGAITIGDLRTGETVSVKRALRDPLLALALSPDGTRVAHAGAGGAVSVDEVPLVVRPGDHVEWLSDRYARDDRLGREGLADAIATRLDRISRATPDESFLIHLDGPWGAGKSTILHFLREQLRDRWLIVNFDAWRQARVGPPWWALLTSLRRTLRAELGWRRGTWLRARELLAREHATAGS